MIKLATSNLYSHLVDVPTHAERCFMNVVLKPSGMTVAPEHVGNLTLDRVTAYYVLGTLETDGSFTPCPYVSIIETMLDMGEPQNLSESAVPQIVKDQHLINTQRIAAAKNVLGAGVIPTPSSPHVPIDCPTKKQNDFRSCDLDAYFAVFDTRLLGTVV
jgi:hypothetical protein